MQQVQKLNTSIWNVTVSHRMTNTDNYLLVRLISDVTKEEITFIPTTHTADSRKDVMTFSDIGSSLNALGLIDLAGNQWPSGYGTYYIYEQANNSNLDYTRTLKTLEVGRFMLYESATYGQGTYNAYTTEDEGYTYSS